MRFDEYTEKHGLAVSPVERFAGLVVEVGVPRGWEPFDSAVGVRVGLSHRPVHRRVWRQRRVDDASSPGRFGPC